MNWKTGKFNMLTGKPKKKRKVIDYRLYGNDIVRINGVFIMNVPYANGVVINYPCGTKRFISNTRYDFA